MSSATAPVLLPHDENSRSVRRVMIVVLALNALVAVAKLITGLITGTMAMIADGFHSVMDVSSNLVGLLGIWLSSHSPDEDHPYGYRRFETMATMAIGGLLLVAAWEIVQTMLERLIHGGRPHVTGASFAVMLGTIAANLFVTFFERRRGRALKSNFLLADASHTATDFMVSLSVLFSLAATRLGFSWMDVVIALLIVGVIGRAGLKIIGQTSSTLADRQMLDPGAIARLVHDIPGLEETPRVRSRGSTDAIYVDIDTRINPAITTDHAYAIERAIKERIQAAHPEVEEVQVHFAPQRGGPTDYTLEARAVADELGLSVHEVVPVPIQDGIALEMHVEVGPDLTLGEAHRQVSEMEQRLKLQLPNVREVLTHIEPTHEHSAPATQTQAALDLRDRALAIANRLYPDANWHHAIIRLALGGYALMMHCTLPASVSVEDAHAIAEHVETSIRNELPLVQRVTIHTEPPPGTETLVR